MVDIQDSNHNDDMSPFLNKLFRFVEHDLKIGILGIPFSKGQPRGGTENGPRFIRDGGLIRRLERMCDNPDVKDYGNVEYELDKNITGLPNMKEFGHVGSCTREVSKQVEKILNDGRLCINLGGDHSIGIGTIDGHMKAAQNHVAVLWVDAHADINTCETSGSGNIHGMPVGLLMKELKSFWPHLPGMEWLQPELSARNIAYIGLRSVDVYERLILEKLGIVHFSMEHIDRFGITGITNMALEKIDPNRNRSIHISFDIDALDSLEAPSTGTAVRGGMTLRESIRLMEVACRTNRVNCVDLVEVNPNIGNGIEVKTTVDAAIRLISAICGANRKGPKDSNMHLPFKQFPATS